MPRVFFALFFSFLLHNVLRVFVLFIRYIYKAFANKQTNKRTIEQTNERTNERTNEHTNLQTYKLELLCCVNACPTTHTNDNQGTDLTDWYLVRKTGILAQTQHHNSLIRPIEITQIDDSFERQLSWDNTPIQH